jgi:hypothetical protein
MTKPTKPRNVRRGRGWLVWALLAAALMGIAMLAPTFVRAA